VEPVVLGVSADERERLRLVLRESADVARRQRYMGGTFQLAIGAGFGVAGGFVLERAARRSENREIVNGGLSLFLSAYYSIKGITTLVSDSYEEETYERFTTSLAPGVDPARQSSAYAEAEHRLLTAAERERKGRVYFQRLAGGLFFLFGAGYVGYRLGEAEGDLDRIENKLSTAIAAAYVPLGTAMFIDSFFPSTTERLAEVWKSDPSKLRAPTTGLSIQPVLGLGHVGIAGTF